MVCLNLIRRFNVKETRERLFHQLKQGKSFSLHSLRTVSFQPRRLWPREPPELHMGALCKWCHNQGERRKGVRVVLELL